MKFVEFTRVPFGPILVNPEMVAAIAPAASDPYQGTFNQHPYGCCVHAGGEAFRVKESALEVVQKLSEARSIDLPPPVHVVGPTDAEIEAMTDKVMLALEKEPKLLKKGKKK